MPYGREYVVLVAAEDLNRGKAQKPILSELMADPKFKNLVYFVVDFDSQKNLVGGIRLAGRRVFCRA